MTSEGMSPQADRRLGEAYRARPRADDPREHPNETAWEAFASGEMEPDARRRLADHIVSCEPCREVYQAVRVLIEGAPGIDLGAPVASATHNATSSWRRYAPALAMAATLVVVVGALALHLSTRPVDRVPEEPGVAPATAPVDAPAGAPGLIEPAGRLAMIKPDVQLPADLITTTRGPGGADVRRFLERFGEAMAPYRDGRFEEASRSLRSMTASHGDVAEVWFYLGVSHLFEGHPAEALAAFDHHGVATAMGDDLLWQRAVALERLGRREESDTVLRMLCGRDGPHRARACAALEPGRQAPPRD